MCEYLSDDGWDTVSQPFVFTVLKKMVRPLLWMMMRYVLGAKWTLQTTNSFEFPSFSTFKWDLRCWQILGNVDMNEFSNLLSYVFSGSQERQDKLREMGFVDILHKLTQASDPNLSDRWVRKVNH